MFDRYLPRRHCQTVQPKVALLVLTKPEANLVFTDRATGTRGTGEAGTGHRGTGTDRKSTSSFQKVPGYYGPEKTTDTFEEKNWW